MECVLVSCTELAAPTASDALLADALSARGIRVHHRAWDALTPAAAAGQLLCLRSTWDYHLRGAEFAAWLGACEAAGATIVNAPTLVRWNMDKGYLRELADAGVAMPASEWFAPSERPDLEALRARHGWDELVVKPRISATAHGTHRVSTGQTLSEADWAPALASGAIVQRFVPEVVNGELSLVYFAGQFSHAARKTPRRGDYRVQSQFGGTYELVEASAAARGLAQAALAAAPAFATYARVDLLETADGPLLMELELIEPELFLTMHPAAAATFADALLASARSAVPPTSALS
jgi:glutathione synthase/RimK-type ligase-like ATP-grasp enzyme